MTPHKAQEETQLLKIKHGFHHSRCVIHSRLSFEEKIHKEIMKNDQRWTLPTVGDNESSEALKHRRLLVAAKTLKRMLSRWFVAYYLVLDIEVKKMGVGAMATNCHKFPNILLPKSLDGDSAPIRFQTDVPLTVKALLSIHASLTVLILRKFLQRLWETLSMSMRR